MQENYSYATMSEYVGQELGSGPWVTIGQDRINQFADCTGDHQWIHVDVERCARESPFKTPIAHGFLTLSLLAAALMEGGVVPKDVGRVINAGVSNVRFRAAVPVNSKVRARFTLGSVEPKGDSRQLVMLKATLDIDGVIDPALTAEVTLMFFR